MSQTKQKEKKPAEKHRLIDDTFKRLMKEIRPLRGWIGFSAALCLLMIGCAVAAPELLGELVNKLYAVRNESAFAEYR